MYKNVFIIIMCYNLIHILHLYNRILLIFNNTSMFLKLYVDGDHSPIHNINERIK